MVTLSESFGGSNSGQISPTTVGSGAVTPQEDDIDPFNVDGGSGALRLANELEKEVRLVSRISKPPSRLLQKALWIIGGLLFVGSVAAAAHLALKLNSGNLNWSWQDIAETTAAPVALAMSLACARYLYRTRALTGEEVNQMKKGELQKKYPGRFSAMDNKALVTLLTDQDVGNLTAEQVSHLPAEIQIYFGAADSYAEAEGDAAALTRAENVLKAERNENWLGNAKEVLRNLWTIRTRFDEDFSMILLEIDQGDRTTISFTKGDLQSLPRFSIEASAYGRCTRVIRELESAITPMPHKTAGAPSTPKGSS